MFWRVNIRKINDNIAVVDSCWGEEEDGYVAVGMGFQTVVAWRTFELRRSHQAVQPAVPALGDNYRGD